MAAYYRVYGLHHLQADCQEPGSAPVICNRVWATFTFLLLQHCEFLNVDISQGSVVTYLRCGGIFTYECVANLTI